ncbi:hypothetical protein ROHU_001343 [Labeo rohita]|uniref:Uncharacterized protein n=1 Tax=Labeo rohita TaxID=84645 RepID=A0A498P2Q9_LABRO|nr:hypothetical protein ROHU_001343 [Labeo rohita]
MLVQVECKGNPKWLRIPVKNDCFDFCEFIKEAKFNLPHGANVVLKDSAGVDVDADIFDELVRTSKVSFKILDCDTAGWDSDVAAILLLLHLLPPTVKGRKTGKISATEAADHVVKFMKVGTSIKAFLERVGSTQPFLLCVGEKEE